MGAQEHRNTADRPAPAATETAAESLDQRPKILVVDDVFDNRDILTRRLIRRGFDVVEAAGGLEALEKVAADRFDLVLLDIMMPDISGNDVLKRIRETTTALELPVIMVTAKSHSEDVVESLELGANDYVTKPVDFAVALARINSQLARKRAAEAEARSRRAFEQKAAELHVVAEQSAEALRRTSETLALEESQRRQSEDRLHYLAYHDGLTGLLNRTAFRDMINGILSDPARGDGDPALLFIDLDRFKAVNDVYGHEVGDMLLQEVAKRLQAIVPDGNPLARLGGDEFGVFLAEQDAADTCELYGTRIVSVLCQPFVVDDKQFQIGASCGIAKASMCDFQLDHLVKAADLAMYRAKLSGRSRYVSYDPTMLEEMKERSAIEVELREAIKNGDIEVAYQPLINAETRQVAACEALVRWRHSKRGLLAPDVFIPIAEDTGLIIPLGELVLRTACAEAANWPSHVRLAVNLSPLQFRNNDLLATIQGILQETGLDPHRLELEITETALLEAREQNVDILRSIRALGIRVSMDDFGTGYSSMSYLQSFEFDKIKIDRRFVRGLNAGRNGAAIIKAIADLGSSVGVALTAEGVETEEELAIVAGYGCTELQGYLFSRPLSAEDALAFIRSTIKPRST